VTTEAYLANKQELVRFLEERVFNPILEASDANLSEADKRKLRDVQDRTRSEKDRFHHYPSAGEVVDNYKSDLHSATAKRVNRELEALKLPTLPSVEREFLDLAGEGITQMARKNKDKGGAKTKPPKKLKESK
jgi:hypothetical protein